MKKVTKNVWFTKTSNTWGEKSQWGSYGITFYIGKKLVINAHYATAPSGYFLNVSVSPHRSMPA